MDTCLMDDVINVTWPWQLAVGLTFNRLRIRKQDRGAPFSGVAIYQQVGYEQLSVAGRAVKAVWVLKGRLGMLQPAVLVRDHAYDAALLEMVRIRVEARSHLPLGIRRQGRAGLTRQLLQHGWAVKRLLEGDLRVA
eukprot:361889-Chlamydomonas_euryale.AAC.4